VIAFMSAFGAAAPLTGPSAKDQISPSQISQFSMICRRERRN
jgi:hypothetical protein